METQVVQKYPETSGYLKSGVLSTRVRGPVDGCEVLKSNGRLESLVCDSPANTDRSIRHVGEVGKNYGWNPQKPWLEISVQWVIIRLTNHLVSTCPFI